MGTSWEDAKREALNRLRWKRSMCSGVGLGWFGTAVNF
jgi:hypothetical protein